MSMHSDDCEVWVPHGRFVLPPSQAGSLSGLGFVVKDVFDIAGYPTGAGNPTWLATHPVPQATHPVITQLLAAGATMKGKVITDELAYSLNGDNVHYGTPINVNARGRVPGGSSSGTAAAVAAGIADFGLGTDTGGSTRVPASYCGIWGIRTTHGRLPLTHMVPLHPSFDTATWFARNASVFARVARALLAPTGLQVRRILTPSAVWGLAASDFAPFLRSVSTKLARQTGATMQDTDVLRSAGDSLETWRSAYVTMGAREAWTLHGDWISRHKPTFAPPIASRWLAASEVTNQEYSSARAEVARIRGHVRDMLGDDAVMIVPSAASIAPMVGESGTKIDDLRMRTMHITCIAGIGGLCQVSIPFRNRDGFPVGVSVIGPAGRDIEIIDLATTLAAGA